MKKILVATAVAAAFGVSGVQAAEDITVDVAVIGAGGAGLSAAVEAANLGAKVVVVEKMGMPGGNTIRAAGGEDQGFPPQAHLPHPDLPDADGAGAVPGAPHG
ncbi:MAG: FAD-dependent oxidoreductase, partial [Sutterella sp.]|nr:FAD-dependent oxidoreductase [Sutterella sp.]